MKPLNVVLLAAVLAGRGVAQQTDTAAAMLLAAKASQAAQAGDRAAFLEKSEAAVALRPDFPQLLMRLAAAQAASDLAEDAMATLERAAALGVSASIDRDEEFAGLRSRKEFGPLARKFTNNGHPQGRGQTSFALREVTGWIDGIIWRQKTGDFFFGDVHGRCVWQRNKDNTLRRFSPEGDELLGVFGLALNEDAGVLWAATSAVEAMRGFTPEQKGQAALAELDLNSGAIRRVLPLPSEAGQSQLASDVALGPDGTVYLSDSLGGRVWRLPPGGDHLELVAEGGELMSPQGLTVTTDAGALLVADRIAGLMRIDLPSGAARRVEPPEEATLVGLDGLTLLPNGTVIAVQTATSPKRVLQLTLDGMGEAVASVTVLEAGHLTMSAPGSGCLGPAGDFFFIGNTGAGRPEFSDGNPTQPRPVPIFQTKPGGR
jgi:sugar lactone lactonase YvrE